MLRLVTFAGALILTLGACTWPPGLGAPVQPVENAANDTVGFLGETAGRTLDQAQNLRAPRVPSVSAPRAPSLGAGRGGLLRQVPRLVGFGAAQSATGRMADRTP